MEARDLRVSDAEREHVGELLQRAVGQGMLSLGEFTERMDTALAAKTRGELNVVLLDLPGIVLAPDPSTPTDVPRSVAAHPVPSTPSAYRPEVPGNVIRGRMSTLTRNGNWHVPKSLYIDTRMSHVTIDFSRAIMASQAVEVTIDDYGSAISLVVPAEATVDLNGVETIGATASNKARTGPPYGPLHLVVRGRVRFGTVTAKYPFGTSLRKMFGQ